MISHGEGTVEGGSVRPRGMDDNVIVCLPYIKVGTIIKRNRRAGEESCIS